MQDFVSAIEKIATKPVIGEEIAPQRCLPAGYKPVYECVYRLLTVYLYRICAVADPMHMYGTTIVERRQSHGYAYHIDYLKRIF